MLIFAKCIIGFNKMSCIDLLIYETFYCYLFACDDARKMRYIRKYQSNFAVIYFNGSCSLSKVYTA